MPATFPSGAKAFTNKTNTTTADASHINDLQNEVTAIEQCLLGTTALDAVLNSMTAAVKAGLAATAKLYFDGVGMTGDTYIQESAANVLSLYSGGIETKLTSGVLTVGAANVTGDFLIGTGGAILAGSQTISFNGSARNALVANETSNLANASFVIFAVSGVAIGSINRNAATSAVLYNTSSDARLKDDRGLAEDVSGLLAVQVRDFTWKGDPSGMVDRGVFAQEAHCVLPRAVTPGNDDLSRPWAVDYSRFVPDLIVAAQQAHARLSALEAARG